MSYFDANIANNVLILTKMSKPNDDAEAKALDQKVMQAINTAWREKYSIEGFSQGEVLGIVKILSERNAQDATIANLTTPCFAQLPAEIKGLVLRKLPLSSLKELSLTSKAMREAVNSEVIRRAKHITKQDDITRNVANLVLQLKENGLIDSIRNEDPLVQFKNLLRTIRQELNDEVWTCLLRIQR